jgi:glutamine synthetase
MAKPHNSLPGCSGHLHFSLQNSQGKNIFYSKDDPEQVTDTLRQFIAGILGFF